MTGDLKGNIQYGPLSVEVMVPIYMGAMTTMVIASPDGYPNLRT